MKYDELSEQIKMDCQIIRSLKEMHNWFVCMRNFKLSSEQLSEHCKKIQADKEYLDRIRGYNNLWKQELEERNEKIRILYQDKLKKGEQVSKLKLVLAGFNIDFAEKYGAPPT